MASPKARTCSIGSIENSKWPEFIQRIIAEAVSFNNNVLIYCEPSDEWRKVEEAPSQLIKTRAKLLKLLALPRGIELLFQP
jgi:hypothetical protein